MTLLVFDIKGTPASRRERIAAAVEAGGTHLSESLEAWISRDPFGETARALITEPLWFGRASRTARQDGGSAGK